MSADAHCPSPKSATVLNATHLLRRGVCAAVCAALCAATLAAQRATPQLPPDDRTRLAEAFQLFDRVGDGIWAGWHSAPFAVLLVTDGDEFLLRHPSPSDDFRRIGYDSLLRSEIFVRPRRFATTLLATFPAVGGIPTIVVGQPAATGRTSTMWVLTLLHEHFHQWQMSHPGYYRRVDALRLARGDNTGMWMLNFAYPYDTARVQQRFAAFVNALRTTISQPPGGGMQTPVARTRLALRDATPRDDDAYLAFQMWQEGVAHYTELAVARAAATQANPSAAFRALPDARTYREAADELERSIRSVLVPTSLRDQRRVAFYGAGAALALHLDQVRPGWRRGYLNGPLSLDRFFIAGPQSRR